MKQALIKTINNFKTMLPMMAGIFLLINLINPMLKGQYSKIFTNNLIWDSLIGSSAGSISFGIPLTSYVIGGELIDHGVSLLAVTAFILAWSMVGVLMLPLEASYLGEKFAIVRNIVNFIFTIIIAIFTILTINIIHG